MNDLIQDTLDDLTSPRSSLSRKGRALNTLEHLIADIYVPTNMKALETIQTFISLQGTFQCNIPSRLLTWISGTSSRLDALTGGGAIETERNAEALTLSTQLVQALSIIQGIVLTHEGSKRYLGRRYALEILLHLFLVARHIPLKNVIPRSVSTPTPSDQKSVQKDKDIAPVSLASAVLDALSCILVDSSPSIRAFEEVSGVKAVVKILKRQGTPREVKIKCMEFLYFYVNSENPAWTQPVISGAEIDDFTLVPTAPNSPTSTRPTHRPALSLSHLSDSSSSSVSSTQTPPRSIPLSPTSSDSSPISLSDTPAPLKSRPIQQIRRDASGGAFSTPRKATPVGTPTRYPKTPRKALQPLNVTQLRVSLDHEALSLETTAHNNPILHTTSQRSVNRIHGHKRAQSSVAALMPSLMSSSPLSPPPYPSRVEIPPCNGVGIRSIEEKKEILRGMMSNADALLEGMNKVGIWGLA